MTLQVLYARTVESEVIGQQGLYTYNPVTGQSTAAYTPATFFTFDPYVYSITNLTVAAGNDGFDRVWFFGWTSDGDLHLDVWSTNGTATGTIVHTQDFFPGPAGASAINEGDSLFSFTKGDDLFFVGNSEVYGAELYKVDGATNSISLFTDIWPGIESSFSLNFTPAGDLIFFTADNGSDGPQLWATDGTIAGTGRFTSLPLVTQYARDLHYAKGNGLLYFATSSAIYYASESVAFPVMQSDSNAYGGKYSYGSLVSSGDILGEAGTGMLVYAFRYDDNAADGVDYTADGVWRVSPGQGPVLIAPGIVVDGFSASQALTDPSGTAYFVGYDRTIENPTTDLWRSDGTSIGTFKISTGLSFAGGLRGAFVGDVFFFVAVEDAISTPALYRLGANNVPERIASFLGANDITDIRGFKTIGDDVYFFLDVENSGVSLWRISGAAGAAPELIASDVIEAAGVVGANLENVIGGATSGPDTLNGTTGPDLIEGLAGNDLLNGSGDNDRLFGGTNDDVLNGGDGNDRLFGELGNDTLDGGVGTDTASYQDATGGIAALLTNVISGHSGGSATGADGVDMLVDIENIAGSGHNDTLNGNSGSNTLLGGAGNDSLVGNAGSDSLDGGTGNDRMLGGAANDFYFVDSTGDIVTELAGEGTADTVRTKLNTYTLPSQVERVIFVGTGNFVGLGNSGSNQFNGSTGDDRFVDVAGGNDTISAGGGSDSMDFRSSSTGTIIDLATGVHGGAAAGDVYSSIEKFFGSNTQGDTMAAGAGRANFSGFGGNDTLTGGNNIDALQGNAGDDSLNGLGGVDAIEGGAGNDTITGGAAKDSFIYSAAGFGQDVITDFADGSDKLKVHSSVASNIAAFSITGNGTTSVLLTQISSPTNTITLQSAGAITITAADFLFY